MQLQIAPNRWSCLPTSFAMVLDIPLEQIITMIGHNGSAILWPDFEEPFCRRAFHIQELIDCCNQLDYAVTLIEAMPISEVKGRYFQQPLSVERFYNHLSGTRGILTGVGRRLGNPHAVAWDGFNIFDPVGEIYPLDEMSIQDYWKIQSVSGKCCL